MAKSKRKGKPKSRNPIARVVTHLRNQVVKDKTRYDRNNDKRELARDSKELTLRE